MKYGKDSMYVFKQCERCLKPVSDDSIHTCTPSELVRNLEAELSSTKEKLEASEAEVTKLRAGRERVLDSNTRVAAECEGLISENAELRKQLEAREGWQLVPIEPTDDMVESAFEQSSLMISDRYKAMLKAAPKP